MIPVLFERDEVDFQTNGLGQLPNVIDSYAHEIGNADYELNLVYPTVSDVDGYSNDIWKELKVTERQILYKPSHNRNPHAFRIYNYEIDSIAQTITVYARSRAYDLGNNVVKVVNINNQTPQTAMNTMKNNLVEPTDFDFYSDMTTTSSTKWERQSGLSTIMGEEGSLIQYWGGEVLRENTRISLYNRIGRDNVTTLRLGKNIQQLNYDLRTDSMVTAIIPYYRYTPEGENQEEQVVIGNTVKSPNFNSYRLPYYQFVEYNEQDDNVTNLTTLNNVASKWFKENLKSDEPTLTINVDMVDVAESTEYANLLKALEQVNVFDTVSVYVSEYDIDMVIKVVSLKYDGFNERNLEVELGSATKGMFDSILGSQFVSIGKQLEEIKKMGIIAQISADGKNTNYHGTGDPNEIGLSGNDGDIYFRTVGTEKQMWQYQDGQWDLILDTSRLDIVKKEVEDAIAQADADRLKAEADFESAKVAAIEYADTKASEWNTKLNAEMAEAETSITKAYTDAVKDGKIYTDTKASEFNTEMEVVKTDLVTTKTKADKAVLDAETAVTEAGFAQVDASTAKENAVTAITSANTAKESANAAVSNAQTALTNSGTALEKAGQALTKATATETETGKLTTSFNNLTQTVGLKADKTALDTVKGTVTQHGLDISANATAVGLKADKSIVDTINQTVSSHTLSIKATADSLAAKAEKTLVDSINKTVNETKATVDLLPEKIELGVADAKTYVDKLTDGSSVANKTEILSGNPVFTDKSDDAVVHVGVDGKSEQNAGSGKNLANMKSTTVGNISGSDGSVLASGGHSLMGRTEFIPISIGSYSYALIDSTLTVEKYVLYNSSKAFISSTVLNNKTGTITISQSGFIKFVFIGNPENDLNNLVKTKFQVEEGKTATTYEPPAPSPDYPIAINSLNNVDVVSGVSPRNLVLASANKFDTSSYNIGYYSVAEMLEEGKKYTAVMKYKLGADRSNIQVFFSGGYQSVATFTSDIRNSDGVGWVTFTMRYTPERVPTTKDSVHARPYLYQMPNSGTSASQVDWFMIYDGDASSALQSIAPEDIQSDESGVGIYKTNILLSEPLRSVGDVKDRLFLDTDGLWKVERNVGEYKADGSEDWTNRDSEEAFPNIETRWFQLILPNIVPIPAIGKSTHFAKITSGYLDEIHVRITNITNTIYIGVFPPKTMHTTLTDYKNWLTSQKNNGTPLTIQYLLATPKIETLSAEQQTKLNNIQSFKGSTYVYTVDNELVPNLNTVFKSEGWANNFKTAKKISMNETKLTVQAGEIATKVSNIEFDALEGKQTATDSRLTQTATNLTSQIGTVTSDLAGKATKTEFSSLTQNVNGIATRVGNSEGKITAVEQTVNGIQTTVGTKANQSQVTQLATQVSSKVESSTYNSKMTQLDSSINLRVVQSDVTDAILADKSVKDTRSDNQLPTWYFANYPKQTVEEFKYRTIMGVIGSATYGQLTTKVPWTHIDRGVVTQIFSSSDGVFQRQGNSGATAWLAWDKVAEAGKLISQINVSTEGILLQGKRIQLDGDVTMTTAFVTDIKAKSLTAVYADIATLKTKVLTADVITSTHLKSDTALIDKLFVTTANITQLTSKSAFITNVKATSLEAVYADIATLTTKILTTDVVTSTHLKSDTALITKLFATDANVNVLTAKTAFVNSVKAVDIAADRITAGTLNAANVNIINLNASKIATGTITGVNSTWNLNNGVMQFSNPTTGDNLQFDQGQITFQNGAQTRYLKYNAEGLQLAAGLGNTGTSLNTSLHLIGGAVGSHQYIQFASKQSSGILQRITAVDVAMKLQHANNGGYVEITNYNGDAHEGKILVGEINIKDANNDGLKIVNNRIESNVRSGSHNIFITPMGTGSVILGDRGLVDYWNIHASAFLTRSTRKSKTNINPYSDNALEVIDAITVSTFNMKQDVANGIDDLKVGFIAEDSLPIAEKDAEGNMVGINTYTATAYLVKAVQELDKKIKQLESGI